MVNEGPNARSRSGRRGFCQGGKHSKSDHRPMLSEGEGDRWVGTGIRGVEMAWCKAVLGNGWDEPRGIPA